MQNLPKRKEVMLGQTTAPFCATSKTQVTRNAFLWNNRILEVQCSGTKQKALHRHQQSKCRYPVLKAMDQVTDPVLVQNWDNGDLTDKRFVESKCLEKDNLKSAYSDSKLLFDLTQRKTGNDSYEHKVQGHLPAEELKFYVLGLQKKDTFKSSSYSENLKKESAMASEEGQPGTITSNNYLQRSVSTTRRRRIIIKRRLTAAFRSNSLESSSHAHWSATPVAPFTSGIIVRLSFVLLTLSLILINSSTTAAAYQQATIGSSISGAIQKLTPLEVNRTKTGGLKGEGLGGASSHLDKSSNDKVVGFSLVHGDASRRELSPLDGYDVIHDDDVIVVGSSASRQNQQRSTSDDDASHVHRKHRKFCKNGSHCSGALNYIRSTNGRRRTGFSEQGMNKKMKVSPTSLSFVQLHPSSRMLNNNGSFRTFVPYVVSSENKGYGINLNSNNYWHYRQLSTHVHEKITDSNVDASNTDERPQIRKMTKVSRNSEKGIEKSYLGFNLQRLARRSVADFLQYDFKKEHAVQLAGLATEVINIFASLVFNDTNSLEGNKHNEVDESSFQQKILDVSRYELDNKNRHHQLLNRGKYDAYKNSKDGYSKGYSKGWSSKLKDKKNGGNSFWKGKEESWAEEYGHTERTDLSEGRQFFGLGFVTAVIIDFLRDPIVLFLFFWLNVSTA